MFLFLKAQLSDTTQLM